MTSVFHSTLNTGKARGYKKLLRNLWNRPTTAAAKVYFNAWYRRVIHTKLASIKERARTIKQRLVVIERWGSLQ
ncbi:MAG: transposase [Planctomycetales bacterium]